LSGNLLMAFGLMLVLEGVLPLLAPRTWRETFQRMIALKDGQLRFIGLASMLAGVLLMLLFH
jgi:uncharacterized protein YjeT (DUF2065 family)